MKRIACAVITLFALFSLSGCGGGSSNSSGALETLSGTWSLTRVTAGNVVINCPGSANITPSTSEACSPSQRFTFTADGHYAVYVSQPTGASDENGTYTFGNSVLQTVEPLASGFHTTTYNATRTGNQISLTVISSHNGASPIFEGQTWTFQLQ